MRDVSELAKKKKPTTDDAKTMEEKERSFEEAMKEIMRRDMEQMLKEGWGESDLVYPDSIKPQWKN